MRHACVANRVIAEPEAKRHAEKQKHGRHACHAKQRQKQRHTHTHTHSGPGAKHALAYMQFHCCTSCTRPTSTHTGTLFFALLCSWHAHELPQVKQARDGASELLGACATNPVACQAVWNESETESVRVCTRNTKAWSQANDMLKQPMQGGERESTEALLT